MLRWAHEFILDGRICVYYLLLSDVNNVFNLFFSSVWESFQILVIFVMFFYFVYYLTVDMS